MKLIISKIEMVPLTRLAAEAARPPSPRKRGEGRPERSERPGWGAHM